MALSLPEFQPDIPSIRFGPMAVSSGGSLILPHRPRRADILPAVNDPETLFPEAFGLPQLSVGDIQEETSALQAEQGALPEEITGFEDLDPTEQTRVFSRAQELFAAVPGAKGHQVLQMAAADVGMDEAVRLLRMQMEAEVSRPWYRSGILGGFLGAVETVFVKAPEWAWNRVIVDPFQELAELTGIDPEMAQRMSPGQIVTAWSDFITPGQLGATDKDGGLKDLEEWDGAAAWVSGGLDIVARLTMDPTLVLGKFRTMRALPFKMEKLLGLERASVAGAAARAQRLRGIARGERAKFLVAGPEEAERIARELVHGRRALTHFLAGNLNMKELWLAARDKPQMQRFLRDVVDAGKDPEGIARLAIRYGMPRRGVGVTLEQLEYLRGAGLRGGVNGAEEAMVSLLNGRFTPAARAEVEQITSRYVNVRFLREEARRSVEYFHGKPVVVQEVADQPRGLANFGDHFFGEPNSAGLSELTSHTELRYLEEHAFPEGVLPPHGTGETVLRKNMAEPFERQLGALDSELEQARAVIEPIARIVNQDVEEGIKDLVVGNLFPSAPLADLPKPYLKDLIGEVPAWLGADGLKRVPLAGHKLSRLSFEMLPHATVKPQGNPYWWVQFHRLGKLLNLSEQETQHFVSLATQARHADNAEKAIARVSEQMIHRGYRRLGLSDDQISMLQAELSSRREELYAHIDGKGIKHPVLESQRMNTITLADPEFLKLFARFSGKQVKSWSQLTAREARLQISNALDRFNNVLKRTWVARPATGWRVALETQARAKAMGLGNMYAHPVSLLAVWLAPYAPKTAERALKGSLRTSARFKAFFGMADDFSEDIADVAVRSTDIGMNQMFFEAGWLSAKEWQDKQIVRFSALGTKGSRHAYRQAQVKFLVEDVMNDRLARRLIMDGRARARHWLDSAEGQAYLKSLPKAERDPGRHLRNVEKIVAGHTANFDEEIITRLVTGDLQAQHLLGKEAKSMVAGAIDNPAALLDPKGLDKILDWAVKRGLSQREYIGRNLTAKIELWDETWRRVRHARSQGVKIDDETVLSLLKGGAPTTTAGIEVSLVNRARSDVQQKLKWLFFDFQEHSRISDMFRWVFPFGNAYQEVMSRWGSIIAERPWVPHVFSEAWQSAEDVPMFMETDPATGEKQFHVPLIGWALRAAGLRTPNPFTSMAEGLGLSFSGNLKGVNLITGYGLAPGMGPIAQMPLRFVANAKPNWKEFREAIFPFGMGALYEDLAPGWTKNMRAFLASDESNEDFARVTGDLLASRVWELLSEVKGILGDKTFDDLSPDEQERVRGLRKTITDLDQDDFFWQAKAIFAIRTAASLDFPTGLRERTPWKEQIDFYRMVAQAAGPRVADRMLVSQFGPEVLAFTVGKTKAVETVATGKNLGRPPTAKARARFFSDPAFRELVETYGTPAWDLVKELWDDKVDPDELDEQVRFGMRKRLTLPELRHAMVSRVGWETYFLFSDQIEQRLLKRGLASINRKGAEDLRAMKQEFVQSLSQTFPEWAAERAGAGKRGERAENIVKLATLAGMDQLQSLEGVEFLRGYFSLRSHTIDRLRRVGAKSLNAQSALRLKLQFQASVRDLLKKYPSGARLWGRYLERDDLVPLSELMLTTGTFGVPPALEADNLASGLLAG